MTCTFLPGLASTWAAGRPVKPAPTMTTSLLFMDRYSLGSVGYGSNAMEQGGGRPNGERSRNRGWQPQGEMRKNGVTASLSRRAAQKRDGRESSQKDRAQ